MELYKKVNSISLILTKYIFKIVLAMKRKFCYFYSKNIKKCMFFSQDGKM